MHLAERDRPGLQQTEILVVAASEFREILLVVGVMQLVDVLMLPAVDSRIISPETVDGQIRALIRDALEVSGVFSTGGTHAPYVWMQCPHGMKSWDCFDSLLTRFGISSAPGAGLGAQGEGWLRFSSFGSRETIEKAAKRLADMDWDAFAVFAGADVRL